MSLKTEHGRSSPYFWYPTALGFARWIVAGVSLRFYVFKCSLRDLCLRSFPLWARQIDTSRHTGDEAVINLSRIFAVTVENLETTLSASRNAAVEISGKDGGVLAALNSGEANLREVVEILKSEQHSKQTILADVTHFTSDLNEMVGEVQHIALQVRMLSFNAAIEAAHAGKTGTGFAVIASEMRQLADMSAETGVKMAKKIEKIKSSSP